jgi:hypothetical protein
MSQEINNLLIRCPRLGHEITFSYCIQESGAFPCSRIIACWSVVFDVEKYLREKMTSGQWDSFSISLPKDKVSSLLEIIEAAKRIK